MSTGEIALDMALKKIATFCSGVLSLVTSNNSLHIDIISSEVILRMLPFRTDIIQLNSENVLPYSKHFRCIGRVESPCPSPNSWLYEFKFYVKMHNGYWNEQRRQRHESFS